ncbi:MAG: sulfatase, partial [Verrucomicrobiales bacterium]|nr:sulfatase [Verrucomicrobiales bacterium]
MSPFRKLVVACFVFLLPGFAEGADRPNFVFFLVDDMGWADIAANNPDTFYETPNIDAFAKSGMRFTNGYAAASICSPTRASILTGRHPVRVNITDYIPGAKVPADSKFLHVEDRDNLALEETTIAELLKEKGRYTTFFAGKWHLGGEGFYPENQGFDFNIGGHERGGPPGGYYSPWKNPKLKAKRDGEYLTERLTEESIAFLKKPETDAAPFLLYLSYYNIHTPIQAYKKHIDHFSEKAEKQFSGPTPVIAERNNFSRGRQDNPELASMVSAVDDSVGAILQALEERGLAEDTVVVFFSDNGGLCTLPPRRSGIGGPGCNLPLRSGKGWLYEGGIREPMIVRAPGVTKAGT